MAINKIKFLHAIVRWHFLLHTIQNKLKEIQMRVGVIGIVVRGDRGISIEMQKLFNEFSDIIIGRMGVPRENMSAISLIVEGTVERISSLTGKLGKFDGLKVKSALTTLD